MTTSAKTASFAFGLVLLTAASAWAAVDPFFGITNVITSNARVWAGALMILGFLGAGGAIALGSHNSGQWARNALFGSIFLVLAGAGIAVFSKVQAWLGL